MEYKKPDGYRHWGDNIKPSFDFPVTKENIAHWRYYVDTWESCRGASHYILCLLDQIEESFDK